MPQAAGAPLGATAEPSGAAADHDPDHPTGRLLLDPTDDPTWLVEVLGFEPLREREFESWFTVANGRTGTRGSLEEATAHSAPALYVAGLFGTADGEPHGPELVVGPEWTRLGVRVGMEHLRIDAGTLVALRRVLDLRQGLLLTAWHHRLPSGTEVTLRTARFASLADRQLLVLLAEADCSQAVRLGGRIPVTAHEPVRQLNLQHDNGLVDVAIGAREGGAARYRISTATRAGAAKRIVAVARDDTLDGALGVPDPERAGDLLERHRRAWAARWDDADVLLEGDPALQQALRFSLFHLIASGDDTMPDVSIGARGLTGPGYHGHVFWDTDVFVLPFFAHTHPPTARALLAYRHAGLAGARRKAAERGWAGALYPWEAAMTGDDVTPAYGWLPDGSRIDILNAAQEQHISADVAWATHRYWQATGDDEFLVRMGAEIILETARFWASRVEPGPDGRLHVHGVIGPDEYHENVSDNAFTNVLARWNVERALELPALVEGLDARAWTGLRERISLSDDELERWRGVAGALTDSFDPATGIYEQFAGFHTYEDIRAVDIAARPFVGELVLGAPRLRRSQIIKQADVLMLAHLLPDLMPDDVLAANYDHYEPRTAHGSSLSPAIHAAVAARLGRLDEAASYFELAAMVDLDNRMGNASQGVHIATMGGLWQAAVMGFGGVRPHPATQDALVVDPRVPPDWEALAFPLRWRGARLHIRATTGVVTVEVGGADVRLALGAAAPGRLGPGRYRATRDGAGWGPLAPEPRD